MKKNYDVVILAGGKGSRIKKILKGTPKPLIKLKKNIFFLDLLLSQLSNLKIRNIYISISHLHKNVFEDFLNLRNYKNVYLICENKKLDTGGAIKNVIKKTFIQKQFLCINGDTVQSLKNVFKKIIRIKKSNSDFIFLSKSNEKNRFGNVLVKSGRVISFQEKQKIANSFINSGIYYLNKTNFNKIKNKKFSLEKTYFHDLIKRKKLKSVLIKNKFDDIGTYHSFKKFLRIYNKDKPRVLLICRKDESYSKKIIKLLKKFRIHLKILYSHKMGEKIDIKNFRNNFDYIFSFRSYFILRSNHLMKSKISINFHPSTPNYRGSGGINYALMKKNKKFGVTTHFMNDKLDNGPIISVKYFKIKVDDNLKKLLNITHNFLFEEAKKYINLILLNKIDLMKKVKKNFKIKWSKKINNIHKLNRLYEIPQKITKKKLDLLLKSTVINDYKPFKLINKKKVYYE
tara:strand:+ start:5978 stop:7348 length:1371 start_codon:yes stop_codon:yes gene_type:complete